MTDPADTEPVENLLDRIHPVDPSAAFMARLLAARPAVMPGPVSLPSRAKVISFPRQWTAVAAAMVIGGAAAWLSRSPENAPVVAAATPAISQPEAPAFHFLSPQESRKELLDVRDLGIARDAQSRPVRLMHATWLDDDIYSRGDGTPPMREARVRDEILPVVLTTY